MDSGGWQVMKRARMLVDQGRVLDVDYDGKLVRGTIQDGKRNQRAGMIINGRTDIENLCNCAESRRTGALCQHTMALGVAVARGTGTSPKPSAKSSPVPGPAEKATKLQAFTPPKGALSYHFAKNFNKALGKGSLGVTLKDNASAGDAEFMADVPFLGWLQQLGQTTVPPHLMLAPEQASGLFKALQGHPRVHLQETALRVEATPLRLPLALAPIEGDRLSLTLNIPDSISLSAAGDTLWIFLPERNVLLPSPRLSRLPDVDLAELLTTAHTRKGYCERSWRWFFQHAEALENAFRIDATALPRMPRLKPAKPDFRLELEGSLNHLAATFSVRYSDTQVTVDQASDQFPFANPERPGEYFERNEAAETEAIRRLEGMGFETDRKGQFVLKGKSKTLRFFASGLPKLERDWTVIMGERFTHVTSDIERIRPELTTVVSVEGGWLDVDIGYSSDTDASLPQHEIRRLLQVGQSHTKLKNGRRVVVDLDACEELSQVLEDISPEQHHGQYRIAASHEDFLENTVSEFTGKDINAIPMTPFPEDTLSELATILRDYQKEGVCWMLARTERGLSGILADEMGLGKTLQSLAVIQALHTSKALSLIVCPTSLLDNWCAEAARFTPDLKTLKIHGNKRDKLWQKADKHDLLVTSYGTLVRDLEEFKALELKAVFLDEASAIKNATTQNAKATYDLQAPFRFALTGTPIENSVRDIWSIMQFVAPGYLGSAKTFADRYEKPLANEAGAPPDLRDRFRRRLRPFILRRTKRRVATELPDRIEKVLKVPLTDLQRDTYTSILRAGREQILNALQKGKGAARMTMLTTLLRLRQTCCDIRLLGDSKEDVTLEDLSSKLTVIRHLLTEALDGGHRVLIFSQFVSMLKLLRKELESQEIKHCYLDGQTKGRQEQVDRFQKGDIPVFLISLKAGGYGLTLTAADTVIHVDPWWNPAVEAQATDRAHRIGQQNVVTAYKLIAEDTVEEKILKLQRRKRQVIDAALDDEQPMMQGLTMGDIEEVLDL